MLIIIGAAVFTGAIILWLIRFAVKHFTDAERPTFEAPHKIAGKRGEAYAASLIRSVLREEDVLLSNVSIEVHGKPAELDHVIVNKYGVFIIEVKNYVGHLYGSEEDNEWIKDKTTDAGNVYEKTVRNPFPQVRRQIYVLKEFLKSYGINVWVEGRVFFVEDNCPVESVYLVHTAADIRRWIHTWGSNRLPVKTVQQICNLLR